MKRYVFAIIMVLATTRVTQAQEVADSFGSPLENNWTSYLDGSTYDFGNYVASWNGYHAGVDTSIDTTPTGTKVFAIANGIVRFAGLAGGYGNNGGNGYAIVIEHTLMDGGAILSLYGHVQSGTYNPSEQTGLITVNTVVNKGQYIGKIADYQWGSANWHHLHFAVHPGSYSEVGQNNALRGYESSEETVAANWWHPSELLRETNLIIFEDTPPSAWYLEDVDTLYMLDVISGYDATPGQFGSEENISRAELCKMVVEGMNGKEPNTYLLNGWYTEEPFTDVNENDWFYDYVMVLVEADVIDGYGNGTFGPNDPVTRSQTAKIVANGFTMNDAAWQENPWSDFQDGDDLFEEALSLYAYGVLNGYAGGTFGPNNNLTRAEAAAIINRAMNTTTTKVNPN